MLYKTSLGIKDKTIVNVISFSGQGFYSIGEEIGVIPEMGDEDCYKIRFINFSGLARKFA